MSFATKFLNELKGWQIMLVLICLHLALYACRFLYIPYCGDMDIFQYLGWRVANGTGLFAEIWDHKGPIIYWINALGYCISESHNFGVISVFTAIAMASLLITYKACSRILPSQQAALIAGVISLCAIADDGGHCLDSVEWVASLALACGMWLHLGHRKECEPAWVLIALGGIVGLCMAIKATLAGFGVYLMVFWLLEFWRNKSVPHLAKRALLSLAGYVCVVSLCFLPFALAGTLESALDASIYFNMFEFRQSANNCYLANLLGTLYIPKPVLSAGVLLTVLVYFLSTGTRKNLTREHRLLIPLAAWLVAEILLTSTTNNFYSHYLAPALFPGWILVGVVLSNSAFRSRATIFAGVTCLALGVEAGYIGLVQRHNFRTNAEHLMPIALAEKLGLRGRDVAVVGSAATCRVMRHAGIKARQKYPTNLLVHGLTENQRRKADIEQDLMRALQHPGVDFLLTETALESLPWYSHSVEFQHEARNWRLLSTCDGINFYEKASSPPRP